MGLPFNLANFIRPAPPNKILDDRLVLAKKTFGIDEDYLLKDYTDYYMDKPPVINTDEGIATLPVNTNVFNQSVGGGEGRDDLSIFDLKNKIPRGTTKTSTGGISDLQNQLSQGTGMQSIMDAYQDVKDNSGDDVSFEEFMDRTAPFGKNPITGVAYKEPRTIADQNRILGYAFSDPSKFTGITSLRDFLPGGKYSLTGMASRGLKGINNAIQGTNFARATTLADYRDMMSYGGYEEREAAREKTMKEAKAVSDRIARDYESQKQKDGKDFTPSGPNISSNKKGKSNIASQQRGYELHGGNGDGGGGQNNSGGAGDRAGNSGGTGGRRGGGGRYR
tara:strand:+ start:795 stop:1799 length:1005 start_codon:yes stop_codon:yes gene_type:complete